MFVNIIINIYSALNAHCFKAGSTQYYVLSTMPFERGSRSGKKRETAKYAKVKRTEKEKPDKIKPRNTRRLKEKTRLTAEHAEYAEGLKEKMPAGPAVRSTKYYVRSTRSLAAREEYKGYPDAQCQHNDRDASAGLTLR